MSDQSSTKSDVWSGRFSEPVDELVQRYTASVTFDKRMAVFDIQGSLAHAEMLCAQKIISTQDLADIMRGLKQISEEIANDSFDFVISFQVIEHIKRDLELVREVKRVLRPGGKFIVTTPNAPMSLTRNPWHIREYTAAELRSLLGSEFSSVEALGVSGNARVMEYYEQNRRSVKRITRFDILDLQHRLPRCLLQFPYDVLNRINRRRLLKSNTDLTTSIRMDDYRIGPVTDESFDLFFVAEK